MREVVLDTETTGLDPTAGHRVVEIGAVELFNHLPTGQVFHCYINPERDMPDEAFAIHGLSTEFLAGQRVFAEIAGNLLDFLAEDPLVIHNAEFDIRFLNYELGAVGRTPLARERAIDTVFMARRKFPGAPANLDALCRRFGIDNSARDKHGALLDAELLAEVYLELLGGREPGLALAADVAAETKASPTTVAARSSTRPPRPHVPSEEERAAHAAFITRLKDPLWSS